MSPYVLDYGGVHPWKSDSQEYVKSCHFVCCGRRLLYFLAVLFVLWLDFMAELLIKEIKEDFIFVVFLLIVYQIFRPSS